MEIIRKNFLHIITIILCCLVMFNTCKKAVKEVITTNTVRDTTYIIHDTIYNNTPIIVNSGRDTVLEKTMYLPSENYDSLVKQFKLLKEELLAKNSYEQTLKYDSSSVTIKDTVQQNKILGRSVDFNLKYPVITNTITNTILQPKKNKVFIGGELGGNKTNLINLAEVGLLYQNKSDQIFKAGAQLDFNGAVTYKVGGYWKIKLKK